MIYTVYTMQYKLLQVHMGLGIENEKKKGARNKYRCDMDMIRSKHH